MLRRPGGKAAPAVPAADAPKADAAAAPAPKAAGVAEAIARSGLAAIDDLLALAERHPRVHGTRQVRDVAAELGEFAAA